MKRIMLCSSSKCCPEALIDGDIVRITDDDGGTVKLTREQLKMLFENLD